MFDQATVEMLMEGVVDTLYMTVVSTFFSYVFGIVMAVILVICRKDGIRPNPVVYSVLDVVVNLTRSFPFLILMIAVIPFTRYIVGTTIGNNATVVPLVIAAAPFVARLIESSLLEVDNGVVEAAQSMGASTWQIITKVLLPEAMPSLINGSAVAAITILGYSAMSGASAAASGQAGHHVRLQPLPDRYHDRHGDPAHHHRADLPELRQLGHPTQRQTRVLIRFFYHPFPEVFPMKKLLLTLAAMLAAGTLVCHAQAATTVKVGASPTPHAEILNAAKDMLKAEGINLEIIEYSDLCAAQRGSGQQGSGRQLLPAQALSGRLQCPERHQAVLHGRRAL